MNRYLQSVKTYFHTHKKGIISSLPITICVILVAGIMGLAIYNNSPHVVYQPVKACSLLTAVEAEDLLGNKVIGTDANEPTISGNTATSKCSYSDENPDQNAMKVIAIAVRSAINDDGVKQNKAEFTAGKPTTAVEAVKGLGQNAYYNQTLGQLNVLDGKRWIILSNGVGSTPSANTLDDAKKLAQKVLG